MSFTFTTSCTKGLYICKSRSGFSFSSGISDVERIEDRSSFYCLPPGSRNAASQCTIFYPVELDICHLLSVFLPQKIFCINIELRTMLIMNLHAVERNMRTHSHETTPSRDETYICYNTVSFQLE